MSEPVKDTPILKGKEGDCFFELARVNAELVATKAKLERARKALLPFVHHDLLVAHSGNVQDDDSIIFQRNSALLKLGHFREAALAVNAIATLDKEEG